MLPWRMHRSVCFGASGSPAKSASLQTVRRLCVTTIVTLGQGMVSGWCRSRCIPFSTMSPAPQRELRARLKTEDYKG
mgnify:CR=1 FL=1